MWDFDYGETNGDLAFGPGRTIYRIGDDTLSCIADGEEGDPDGGAMGFADNTAPSMPSSPTPNDDSIDQDSESLVLSWECSDSDGHSLTYSVFFCSESSEVLVPVATDIADTSYTVTDLSPGTQYAWCVVATDGQIYSESPVWRFYTEEDASDPYTLTTSVSSGEGTISDGGNYESGVEVELTATPASGYRVKAWSGTDDDSSTSTINTVTMTSDKNVTVAFEPIDAHTLTVNMGSGDGSYAEGELRTIIAGVAPMGQEFDQWIGDTQYVAEVNSSSTTVTMPSSDVTVTATYQERAATGWNYVHGDLSASNCYPYGSTVQTDTSLSLEFEIDTAANYVLTGDVDGDGALEIVTTSGSSLSIYSGSGTLENTFALPQEAFVTLLQDVDGDGALEIGLGSGGVDFAGYVYQADGTLLKTFLGQNTSNSNAGKTMHLLGLSQDKMLVGYNAGWGLTPRGVAAFDYATESKDWYYQIGPATGNYSIADMDADGFLDLTMSAYTVHNGVSGNDTTDGDLYLVVVDESGTRKLSQIYPSPSNGSAKHVFADLDSDGIQEIIGFEGHDSTNYPGQSQIHVYDMSGNSLDSFDGPDDTSWTYAIGDLDSDGSPDIVASAVAEGKTYVSSSGVEIEGTVRLVCDLTGDGNMEVVLMTDTGWVRVLDKDLTEIDSIQAGSGNGVVIASDVDADGVVELLCRTDHLYILGFSDESGSASPPTQLAFSTQPSDITAGNSFDVTVEVQDDQGRIVTDSVVAIVLRAGGWVWSSMVVSGSVTFSNIDIKTAGTYTLTASAEGLVSATSDAFTVNPASASQLVFIQSPGYGAAWEILSPNPRVAFEDDYANVVTTCTDDISLSVRPSAMIEGIWNVSAVAGVATFTDLQIKPAGTYQLQATSSGYSVTSDSFVLTAAPALSVTLTDSVDPANAGSNVTYTVSYGNTGLSTATNVVITEVLPAGLSLVSATGDYSNSDSTITWTIGTVAAEDSTAGSVSFTAKVSDSLSDGGTITNSQLTINCDETDAVMAAAETTTVNDSQAPQLGSLQPVAGAEWVACEPLIQLFLIDGGSGVDINTVMVAIEDCVIYTGWNEVYDTTTIDQAVQGVCKRTGSVSQMVFTFKTSSSFDYEQQVDVVVTASDRSGNSETYTYDFITELRSFGANAKVNSDSGTLYQDHPSTAVDSEDNLWVVWDQETSVVGDSDIYIGQLADGENAFSASRAVYMAADVQSHPVLGITSSDQLIVAWQGDDPNGMWDVFVSTSGDGSTWSSPVKVNVGDPCNTSNQIRPALAVDSNTDTVYVAYVDDRAGNQDIWLAHSSDGLTWTEQQITDDTSDQTNPSLSIDPNGLIYLPWTDHRNASLDLYGAGSDDGWIEEALVSDANDQSDVQVVAYGRRGHLVWVEQDGTSSDVYYALGDEATIAGAGILDSETGLVDEPSMAVATSETGDRVFIAWTDSRNMESNADTDIYYAEQGSSWFGTNILVNDDSGAASQSSPQMGIDGDGNPYIVWVDERNGNKDIYYAGAMSLSDSLPTQITTDGDLVQVEVTNREHLAVEMSTDALPDGVTAADITIREVANPPEMPGATGNQVGLKYEYGPSGLAFDEPVTLRIPLEGTTTFSSYRVYRYDPNDLSSLYYPWTDEGILNPAIPSGDGTYLEVQVEHFSIYGSTGFTTTPGGGGGGGGGGCALTPYPYSGDGGCGPIEFFLPFGMCVLAMVGLRVAENRRRHVEPWIKFRRDSDVE